MHQTISPSKDRIVRQLQTIFSTVLCAKQVAYRSLSQRTERSATRIVWFPVKPAFIYFLPKDREFPHFTKSIIVDSSWPYCPVTGPHCSILQNQILAFQQMPFELFRRPAGENLIKLIRDTIYGCFPHRITPIAVRRICNASLEIHKHLIFGYAAGHQLPITTENVTASGLNTQAITLLAGCDLCPIVFLSGHNIHRPANNGKAHECQNYCNKQVARHNLFAVELTHSAFYSGTLIIKGGWSEVFSTLSLLCFSALSTWLSRHCSVNVLELESALNFASSSSFSILSIAIRSC